MVMNYEDKGWGTVTKNAAPAFQQPKETPSPPAFSSYRVKDIILDENFKDPNPITAGSTNPHDFEYYGKWNGIGTILIEPVDDISSGEGNPTTTYAFPLFPNIKHYPLKNEIVWVVQLADANVGLKLSDTSNYYLPPINIWNSQLHNAMPDENQINTKKDTVNDYQAAEEGSSIAVRRADSEGTDVVLGNTFIEDNVIKIHPLLPYEGDIIYEGRFGNSIRFGSTVKTATHKNDWSSIGNDGDPITILRNGQSYDQRAVDKTSGSFWVPCLENINNDQSSIYLTSTQQVPLNLTSDIPSSYDETKIAESPVIPSQYSGNQILLNSGRLVFNAKNDHIILSADKSIHLSTKSSINLDTGDQIVLNTDNAKGKITLLSDKIYLGLPDGSSEGEVGAELQSLVLGEDLILVLNTIYYMISKIQGALAASNIETEQGTVSDASLLTNAQPLQTLLDNFKQLIGEPNSSPLLSKTTKTNR
jgi:hypothetical protein